MLKCQRHMFFGQIDWHGASHFLYFFFREYQFISLRYLKCWIHVPTMVCCVRIFICNWTIGHVRICGTKPSHRGGSPKSSLCHVSQLLLILPPCLSLTLFILQLLILILNKKKSGSFAAVSSYDGSASFNCRRELTGGWSEDKTHIWRKPTVFACDGSETHKTCFA